MAAVVGEPPRVAVVTPTLDTARFLRETVESVLSQDYPHIDYLVMDGGSRDGSVELLRGYGDRLRFVSEPDGGQADAVNRGFERTRGEIFTFLNADDTYRRGAVSAAVEALERRPEAGVVYGEADYIDDRGAVVRPYPTRPFDAQRLADECYICQPAAFIRREAWSAAGGLDARLHFAFDYDLWIRLSRIVPFVHLERRLATSRMHRQNKTLGSRGPHYREAIGVLKRHYGRVPMRWLVDYAAHLVDGVDQFYEPSHLGRRARALALALALRYHPGHPLQTFRDWQTDGFTGRWDDGWISKSYVSRHRVAPDARRLTVTGRHEALVYRRPLVLSVRVDGRRVGGHVARARGPFSFSLRCPPGAAARTVEIRSAWTWRPRAGGDLRRLSCYLDSVTIE